LTLDILADCREGRETPAAITGGVGVVHRRDKS
jgi:hypothetical protein